MAAGAKKTITPLSFKDLPNEEHVMIFDAQGNLMALVKKDGGQYAKFIVKACNRYDTLMIAHNLCRDRMVGQPRAKKYDPRPFLEISAAIAADVEAHGR